MSEMMHCPDPFLLQQFLMGRLTGRAAASVADHLLGCPHCQNLAARAAEEDGLVHAVRGLGLARADQAAVEGLLDWARTLPEPSGIISPRPAAAPDRAGGSPEVEDADATPEYPANQEASGAARPNVAGYEILGEIGRGGVGVVYRARQLGLSRLVALKTIRAGGRTLPQALARFRAEARVLSRLHHPQIVQVYEIGEHEGNPYFTLELVEGLDLARRLLGVPQEARTAARLVESLAEALEAAHQAGIVHRDLKPANILLAGPVNGPLEACIPKISDFGLAKQLDQDSHHTEVGQVLGTPSYMAPEQALGRHGDIGPSTDVYSLGAILYEMLTGHPPVRGATTLHIVQELVEREPVPPRRLQPAVPRDLEVICLKCLEKDPHRRYPTAGSLADELRRFRRGEPIKARPAGAWERGLKWSRAHPVGAALVLVSVLALASLTFGSSAWIAYEHQQRRARDQELQRHRQREATRGAAESSLRQAQVFLDADNLQGAQVELTRAQALWLREGEAVGERAEVERLLRVTARRLAARAAWERFRALADTAFLHTSHSVGLNNPGSVRRSRQAAREALAVFQLAGSGIGDGPRIADLPAGKDRVQARNDCYALLLLLAEAVAQPLEGEEAGHQAGEALHILEHAAWLRPPTPAYHLHRATCLARRGDRTGAAVERRRAAVLAPETATDHFLLGSIHYHGRELEKAVTHFQAALRVQPDHYWSQYFLAVCALQGGQPALAERGLAACAALRQHGPDCVWLHVLRGLALGQVAAEARAAGRTAQAREYFTAAARDFKRALALGPDTAARYNLLVNRGTVRLLQGRLEAAQRDLEEAIALCPREFHAYWSLARVHEQRKDHDRALAALDRAAERAPPLSLLVYQRGQVQRQRGDLEAAARDFAEAIRRCRTGPLTPVQRRMLPEAHTELGKIHFGRGRFAEALGALDAAVRVCPEHRPALRLRGSVLVALGRPAEAVQACDRYLRHGRPQADVFEARALAWLQKEQPGRALGDLRQALELEPESAPRYVLRGWAYLAAKQPRLALDDFKRALALDPNSSDAYHGRGHARLGLDDLAGAVRDAERGLTCSSQPVHSRYKAARLHARVALRLNSSSVADRRRRHEDRALQLLRLYWEGLSPGQRESFRQALRREPALLVLQARRGFPWIETSREQPAGAAITAAP